MNLLTVLVLLLIVRLSSVFIVQTYFVPDEFWQSLEVAHKLTFGYGYLTWEWVKGIRSYIYPLIIALSYKILALLNLDTANLLILLPRILQAILSAYSDYRFFIWCGKKKWSLFLIILPWFWFYTGSRTLANTFETSLTTIGLSYFPWHVEGIKYFWFAAICCFLRPTAAIIWIPLCFLHLRNTRQSAVKLFTKFLIISFIVGCICIAIDSRLHGEFIVTPYEFLKYNIVHNIGSFYGSHPWYWYFVVGLPTVLGINFIPFIIGIVETIRKHEVFLVRKYLAITILLSLLALSAVEHKEFRFITSLLPLCLYIVSDTLTRWSYKASRAHIWLIAGVLVFANAVPAWYLSTIHQKGRIELMPKLQQIARDYRDENNHRATILFLMPCHSTPFYSHVHENVTMRFLTCEPNFKNEVDYRDEANQFFRSPVHWLRSHIPSYPPTARPSHVVLFEPLVQVIDEFLVHYKEIQRIPNSEANEGILSENILNEWSERVKNNKTLDLDYLLKRIHATSGRNILVYQRLTKGEENKFNRAEYNEKKSPTHTKQDETDQDSDRNEFN